MTLKKSAKPASHFSRAFFGFFRELAQNNDRAWFEANRERYEREVKAPIQQFITDFGPKLAKISKRFVADPRPNGGSMFRIYRDVRFSKDKSPYKTNAALHFRHAAIKDVHAPGFYLHLEPGDVFSATGLWHPEPQIAVKIREAIIAAPAKWKRALAYKPFAQSATLGGESYARPPRGCDPAHPLIDDLKRKDFISVARFNEKDACASDFIDRYADSCRAAAPFMKFLTESVGLEF